MDDLNQRIQLWGYHSLDLSLLVDWVDPSRYAVRWSGEPWDGRRDGIRRWRLW